MRLHANRVLAGLYLLCLPNCFAVERARAVGLGGLRAEVGAASGRPFKLFAGRSQGEPAGSGGGRPDNPEVYVVVGRGGRVPEEAVLLVMLRAEAANQTQRDIFRAERQRRADGRNRAQADCFRRELAERRAAKAAATV